MIKLFFLTFIFLLSLEAKPIDINSADRSILKETEISVVSDRLDLKDIQASVIFEIPASEDINMGFQRDKAVWVKLSFYNNSERTTSKILKVQNPLLEEVFLYDKNRLLQKGGMLYTTSMQTTIDPSFEITLTPYSSKIYYLKVFNHTTSLRFSLFLYEPQAFDFEEHSQLSIIMIALGIILALFLYNLLLYFYSRESAYIYYGFYLIILVAQQLTYLGITPIYFSKEIVEIDNLFVVFKVNAMYITAALFAIEFLNTKKYPWIDRIYNYIIIAALIEIPLFGTPWFYYPEVGILTGLIFIIFNMYAAIHIYNQGYKQARFYIAGWSVMVVAFFLMILDGLGVISIMANAPHFILYATVIEALLLSLAFSDRFRLLRMEKEKTDRMLVNTLKSRQAIIKSEIKKQTKELESALENKKILLKEVHHRTKNNLQLILAILRMQAENVEPQLQKGFKDLENRISAIATTHELLYTQDDLQFIDMFEYINELCEKTSHSLRYSAIACSLNIDHITLPFKEASYIGLLINEILINAIKHSKSDEPVVEISIDKKGDEYILRIADNGREKVTLQDKDNSLGMLLIKTIVEYQLDGKYEVDTQQGVSYTIRFKL